METKFVFFGADDVAVTALEALKEHGTLPSLVITTPDKPAGRKNVLTPPAVKLWADDNNIESLQPEKLDTKFTSSLSTNHYPLGLVVSYGKIIPKSTIESFDKGILNIHPSMLPLLRGASPVKSAILEAHEQTGVTIMLLDEEMDHGPILTQSLISLSPREATANELRDALMYKGVEILLDILPKYLAGNVDLQEQDHSAATFCSKFTKEQAFVDPLSITEGKDLDKNYAIVRALSDKPGSWTTLNDKRVRILSAKVEDGKLLPVEVIPEGKKQMPWADYLKGNPL